MKIFKDVHECIGYRNDLNHSLGFVPTMGALHAGHARLIKQATMENEENLVSIYVNPTQFTNQSDLDNYPDLLAQDIDILKKLGVSYLLLPSYQQLYPDDYTYKLTETDFSNSLCGKSRPGHFDGVLTVVLKLFNIVRPTKAYFGEKDFQQLELIRKMVGAFFLATEIVPVKTKREESGLALSSRNQRLSPEVKNHASMLFSTISSKTDSLETMEADLTHSGFDVDYLEEHLGRRFVAAEIEGVRLIDNVEI